MTWPPQKGELWLAVDRWPATELEPEVPGGALVMVLWGELTTGDFIHWWQGYVLGPGGRRFIKAVEGDLIPGDDPRLCAPAA